MLNWLADRLQPIRRVDPQFGAMRYVRDGGFWEARVPFDPVASSVDLILSGDLSGPTDQQREFFRAIEQRYLSLVPEVERTLDSYREDAPRDARFVLAGIDLPQVVDATTPWELLYNTDPKGWFYAVEVREWEPVGVSEEC